uniref:Uncharacterized protein n=1 Tax=Anguilla anguilla TaxID=7936 RepID=A0A0E9UY73_ANGAN
MLCSAPLSLLPCPSPPLPLSLAQVFTLPLLQRRLKLFSSCPVFDSPCSPFPQY